MPKALEIVLLIVVPAAWGLAVEFVFEHIRRRRAAGQEEETASYGETGK